MFSTELLSHSEPASFVGASSTRCRPAAASRRSFDSTRSAVYPLRALFWICLAVGASVAVKAAHGQGSDGSMFLEMIKNVQASEAIYRDIEMVYSTDYRDADPDGNMPEGLKAMVTSHAVDRRVYQGNCTYIDQLQDVVDSKGQKGVINYTFGYDGHTGRSIRGKVVNIIDSRLSSHGELHPHDLLIPSWLYAPLSVWLMGDEYANKEGFLRGIKLKVDLEGKESKNALMCFKLRCVEWPNGGQPEESGFVMWVWMAIERNYLPMRIEGYMANSRTKEPELVCEANDLRELKPGIWCPYECSQRAYKQNENDVMVLKWSKTYKMTSVMLDPQYDIELFRDIPIPDDAIVHYVKDGKIVKTIAPKKPSVLKKSNGIIYIMLVTNTVAIVGVIAVSYIRRIKKKRMQEGLGY